MVTGWRNPEVFLRHKGTRIFHAYKDEYSETPLEFWYSTSAYAAPDSEYEFDVRDLPGFGTLNTPQDPCEHKNVIKRAIDSGLLLRGTPFGDKDHD
jgi:hypothetical protein